MKYAALVLVAACAGKVPETRYYQLATQTRPAETNATVALAIEPLVADAAYDDDRIVYRLTPYRLDYYNYQRWSAPPGQLVGNFMQDAFMKSGRFRAVMHEASESAPVTLGGRLIALEEVDKSKTEWLGHVAIELTLTDNQTNKIVWSQQYDEIQPLKAQTPEALAEAVSTAMTRITQRALPEVAQLAEQQQAAHAAAMPGAKVAR
ncbi:MAG: membrane integrity-associated transporter subunit PqiC [Deltaproteobacteria bacterium]|nr:membrane integrity-associated transporter subunit PqiC [Deltaproteobacteria bacterium]